MCRKFYVCQNIIRYSLTFVQAGVILIIRTAYIICCKRKGNLMGLFCFGYMNIRIKVIYMMRYIKSLISRIAGGCMGASLICSRGRLREGGYRWFHAAYDSRRFLPSRKRNAVMFSRKEQQLFAAPYFRLIRRTDNFYEIQSKNTGHFWIIQKNRAG